MCCTSAATSKPFFLSGKDNQAAAKEQAVNAAKEALEVSRHEYEKVLRLHHQYLPFSHAILFVAPVKVTERLLLEYESFKSRKVADIKEIILSFVTLQVCRWRYVMHTCMY